MSRIQKILFSALLVITIAAFCQAGRTPPVDDDEDLDEIVGGKKANLTNFQFLTAILRDGEQFCGGSLVAPNKVLTAAHCVDFLEETEWPSITVMLNTTTINPPDAGAIQRGVTKIFHHRNYNSASTYNDIAVITLASPVHGIKPIPLPPVGSTLSYANMWGSIVGFGRTNQTAASEESEGPTSNVLLESSVQVISNSNCSAMYGSGAKISVSQVCAYARGTDTCQGDSGGPLIVDGIQVGVVSWGFGCADDRYPGVYTRLTFFYAWLKANLV